MSPESLETLPAKTKKTNNKKQRDITCVLYVNADQVKSVQKGQGMQYISSDKRFHYAPESLPLFDEQRVMNNNNGIMCKQVYGEGPLRTIVMYLSLNSR